MLLKKYGVGALLFVGLLFSFNTDSSAKTVSTMEELNEYLEGKENESVKVTLAKNIKVEYDYLMLHNNVYVEIDGNHTNIEEAFEVSSWGTGNIVFKNFNFVDNGEFGDDVYFSIQDSGEGTVTVDSSSFKGLKNEMYAPLRDEANDNNLIVTNSLFENNSSYHGGGIEAQATDAPTIIKNSSFINNKSVVVGGGAYTGLESTKGITIENSYFESNTHSNSEIEDMGEDYPYYYSGAIELNLIQGNEDINIKDSYFKNNRSEVDDTFENPTSGGISIHRLHEDSQVNLTGNTFENNRGEGGGGAILVKSMTDKLGQVKMENNTFHKNNSDSLDNDHYNGGAVLIRNNSLTKNGPVFGDVLLSKNNTFYENFMTRSTQVRPFQAVEGGALASYQLNGKHNMNNDLLVGNYLNNNQTISRIFENVFITDGEPNGEGTLGFDNGEAAKISTEMVFGKYPVELVENQSKVKAGILDNQVVVPTLPIAPKMNDQIGIANMNVAGAPTKDQRGYNRVGKNDNGAIEISSVVYDANKGNFTLNELTKYDGKTYYEGKNPKQYVKVDVPAKDYTIIDGKKVLNPVRSGYTFLGWSNVKNPHSVNSKFIAGKKYKVDDQLVLYAVWKETKYSLKYYNNGKTTGVIPTQKEVKPETTVTVKNPTKMKRKGYKFIGWSPKANATKADANYKVGKNFKLTKNIKLYAVWKR